jgi:hypothetical protein
MLCAVTDDTKASPPAMLVLEKSGEDGIVLYNHCRRRVELRAKFEMTMPAHALLTPLYIPRPSQRCESRYTTSSFSQGPWYQLISKVRCCRQSAGVAKALTVRHGISKRAA